MIFPKNLISITDMNFPLHPELATRVTPELFFTLIAFGTASRCPLE